METTTLHGELLCEALDIHPCERVLDVATDNGVAAVAAARRWADVVAIHLVEPPLDSAKGIADAYGVTLETQVADAQDLPFEDDTFDVVMSTFGSMFAPDQQVVADEAIRVCRPSGRIGLTAWAQASLVGDMSKVIGGYVPAPGGWSSAIEWVSEDRIRERFGNRINGLRIVTRQLTFRYRSAMHMVEHLQAWDGPARAALDALDDTAQQRLGADLLEICTSHNRATDGTFVAPSDYLEIVATVR